MGARIQRCWGMRETEGRSREMQVKGKMRVQGTKRRNRSRFPPDKSMLCASPDRSNAAQVVFAMQRLEEKVLGST